MSRLNCAAVFALLSTAAHGAAVPRLAYATFLLGNYGVYSFGTLTILPRAVADGAGNTYVADTLFSESRAPHSPDVEFTFDTFVMKVPADGKNTGFVTHVKVQIVTGLALDAAGNIYVVGGTSNSPGFIAKLAPDGSVLYTTQISALPLAVTADATGAAYVTGTAFADFQTTPGVYKTSVGPSECTNATPGAAAACSDAFVAKISPDGASIIFATFLGGSANDSGLAIAVDQTGSAVVGGQTFSSDFPVTQGAFQPAYGGGGDGFMARLDSTGRNLTYATFIGGSNQDSATGVVLDGNQNAYLAGSTKSSDFPVTPGAFQPVYRGSGDAFFLKLSPLGQPVFSSYLGGPTADSIGGIAIGAGNRFYLALEDSSYGSEPAAAFVLQLDHRQPTPCDPTIAIIAVDAASGNVVDHYALRPFAGSDILGPSSLSVDGSGLVHIVGRTIPGPLGNLFAITPGAASSGNSFLARVSFSGTEEFAPACMVNAASFDDLDVSVAPGEIVSLFGIGLGPPDGQAAQPASDGAYPRQLGGTQVLIGGTALPLLYVSASQVKAVVPYSLSTGSVASGTNLTIEQGSFTASYRLQSVWPAWPAIFTRGGYGSYQVAALNQDGSVNGPDSPASVGSVVSLWATGLGHLAGAFPDGAITPLLPPWPGLAESFQAYIAAAVPSGAVGMEVLYAGPAPGMPPGVYQVNARVPDAARSGQVSIRFAMDGGCAFLAPCLSDLGPYLWIQAH